MGVGLGGERLVADTLPATGPNDYRTNREKEILRPSDMIAVGDSFILRVWSDTAPPGGWSWPEFWGPDELDTNTHVYQGSNPPWSGWGAYFVSPQQRRHGGRFNVAFCDGHVEYTRFQLLFAWQDDRLRRWNNDNLPHRETLPGQGQ
jgi:prepilin-type processing-associated H-X9-DG protein